MDRFGPGAKTEQQNARLGEIRPSGRNIRLEVGLRQLDEIAVKLAVSGPLRIGGQKPLPLPIDQGLDEGQGIARHLDRRREIPGAEKAQELPGVAAPGVPVPNQVGRKPWLDTAPAANADTNMDASVRIRRLTTGKLRFPVRIFR